MIFSIGFSALPVPSRMILSIGLVAFTVPRRSLCPVSVALADSQSQDLILVESAEVTV